MDNKPIPNFSNPRREAMIEDWPFGSMRCRARFVVEVDKKRGERVARYTENKTRTDWNKPKRTTYATRYVIVDGDDERTYLLSFSKTWGHLVIHQGDMKYTLAYLTAEDERFAELFRLIALSE